MKINEKTIDNRVILWIDLLLLIAVLLTVWFLFFAQAEINEIDGSYPSDLDEHINTAINEKAGYSLMSVLFRLVYYFLPNTYSVTFLLAITIVLTIIVTAFAIKNDTYNFSYYIPLAIALLFVSSIYIPAFHTEYYRNNYFTQPWHNSTYILMRFFSIIVMIYYFRIEKNYLKKINFKDAVIFTISLTLANFAKPNFVIAFAPMMLLFLIGDFIKTKGGNTKQAILFGVCVLISLTVLVWQSNVLYPDNEESGIAFTLQNMTDLLTSWNTIALVISNFLFPIIAVLSLGNHLISRQLKQTWVMVLFSWLETVFLTETGVRSADGNFGWGILFTGYFLFAMSIKEIITHYKNKELGTFAFLINGVAFSLHILSGLHYFSLVLRGMTYYI